MISRLPNGVRVVSAPLKERKSVSMSIWVHVGGRDEDPAMNGMSHFLEHMVFKGTAKRSANQIKEAVEGVGGSLNAFTAEEYTCFLAKTSHKHFHQVFDVLADMVLNASLREEDVKKERGVILEEIKMTQDQPSELVDELLAGLVWSGHALGRPLAGTLKTVGRFTQKDIENYRNHFYEPSLITVVAAGAIEHGELLKTATSHFSAGKPKNNKKLALFDRTQTKPTVKTFNKSTEQTHLALGIHALPKNHPDEYVLDILSVLLGGNMSSRLFNEVREERGLAYEISSFVRKYQETGAFIVSAGVDNKKTGEAIDVILKELDKTTRESVGSEELTRAKEFYLGQLDLGLESSMSLMLWVGESAVCFDKYRTAEEVIKKVEKITAEDLQRVAGEIFSAHSLNLAVLGPKVDHLEKNLDRFSFPAR